MYQYHFTSRGSKFQHKVFEKIINLSELFERKQVTDNLCKTKHKSSKGEWSLKNQDKIIKFLNETENPYILKNKDMVVEIEYSDVKKTFNECMINILKQKKKMC